MSQALTRPGRRIPWGLLGMFALVGLFEWFVSAHSLRFSRIEPDDWKYAAEVATRNVPAGGVLLLGDSQIKFGISPLQLEAEVGQPAQCLALQGGQAPGSYFLLRKALQAGMAPSAIVVDFEPHLLREAPTGKARMWAELGDLSDCFELAQASGDLAEFGSMALAIALPSYRERLEIRTNLMAALHGETPNTAALIEMVRRNRGMNRGAIIMSKDLGQHEHDLSKWGNFQDQPWAAHPVNDLYAQRLLRLAQDHQIPVYGVIMPLAPGVQAKYDQTGMGERHLAWLQKLQGRFPNFQVLDWRQANYGRFEFLDALHLNSLGASLASKDLGRHLRQAQRAESTSQRWTTMPAYRPEAATIAVEDTSQSDAVMRATASLRR